MVTDMRACLLVLALAVTSATAQEEDLLPAEVDRDPAAVQLPIKKKNYPGAVDEEPLQVQAALPEAAIKTDARSLQRDVYKQLFNQELKEERHDEAEE